MSERRSGTVLLLLTVASSCSTPEPTEEQAVPLVEQIIDRDQVLELVEELRIDGNREDVALFRVRGAALDADRSMYVLDAGNHEIVVFDSLGAPVRTIGREGEGPGEFTSPRSMWMSGDTLAVADSGNRFHLFRSNGEHLVTRVFLDVMDGNDFLSLGSIVRGPTGWVTVGSAYFRTDHSGNDAALAPVLRTRLFEIEWAEGVEEVGFRLTHEPVGQMVGAFFVQPPFSYSPRFVLDGLGRVHAAREPAYTIDVHSFAGEMLYRVENEYPVAEVTRQDLEQWREGRACGPQSVECDDSRTQLALRMDIPSHKPVVAALVGFPSGHLAVMRSETDPDPEDRLSMGEYDLFGPEGDFLGRLPIGLSPRWFDGTTLVATVWDEMMVPSMVRYRVGS